MFLIPAPNIHTPTGPAAGQAMRINPNPPAGRPAGEANACWVALGDASPQGDPALKHMRVMRLLAHELGHVLVGYGHPDEGGGPAPLPGTNPVRRLMCSGSGAHRYPDILLVKGEWDEAEKWLVKIVDPPAP